MKKYLLLFIFITTVFTRLNAKEVYLNDLESAGKVTLTDGIYETNQSLTFGTDRLNVASGEVLIICGDLILDKMSVLSNAGSIITSGDIILKGFTIGGLNKFENSGNIIVGGDFLESDPETVTSRKIHSGNLIVHGNIDINGMVASGRTWASSVSKSNVGHLSILSDGQSATDVVYVNHIIHHFEYLKAKGCLSVDNQKIIQIENDLENIESNTVDFGSQSNLLKNQLYNFNYSYDQKTGNTTLSWKPSNSIKAQITNFYIETSLNKINYEEVYTQKGNKPSSTSTGLFIYVDANTQYSQKYYKLIAERSNGTQDIMYLKGPSEPRLAYIKRLFAGHEVTKKKLQNTTGQDFDVYTIFEAPSVFAGNITIKPIHSITSFNIYNNELIIICGSLKGLDSSFKIDIKPLGGLIVTENLKMEKESGVPPYYHKNNGIILVGQDYEDQFSGNIPSGYSLSSGGALVTGGTFINAKGSFMNKEGVFAETYTARSGKSEFLPIKSLSEVFKQNLYPVKTTLLFNCIDMFNHTVPRGNVCSNGLSKITSILKLNRTTNSFTLDMLTQVIPQYNHQGKLYQKIGGFRWGSVSSSSHEILKIRKGETLMVCGDLYVTGNSEVINEGNLLVSGSIILEDLNVYGGRQIITLMNSGFIGVGGDFKGYEEMVPTIIGHPSALEGKVAILGKAYTHDLQNGSYAWKEKQLYSFQFKSKIPLTRRDYANNYNRIDSIAIAIESYFLNKKKFPKVFKNTSQPNCRDSDLRKLDADIIKTTGILKTALSAQIIKSDKSVDIDITIKEREFGDTYVLKRIIATNKSDAQTYVIEDIKTIIKSQLKKNGDTYTLTFKDDRVSKKVKPGTFIQYKLVAIQDVPLSDEPSTSVINLRSEVTSNWIDDVTNLPITLSTFTATIDDGYVDLDWIDEQEVNTSHFIIQRSVDGKNYSTISEEIQAAGNSNKEEVYAFTDENVPNESMIYYKLVEFDFDGKSEEWVRIVHQEGNSAYNVNIFPIPADTKLNVEVQNLNEEDGEMTVRLIHATDGLQYVLEGKEDFDNMEFNVSSVPPGVYIIEVFAGNKMIHNQKIIIR
ncbi:T9SS type A sorting domain-containing protein [Flammeovirga kamogawensis]|uniref:T9SS type A sorting domain-containing protein n=1 Tax=Flammeovirga kamogawensis TaxID=373891 RepID=A0ABX8GZT3_9BACT|nr:T9SS type A sorting domain-containing protein [Flammeovirga kamogawensis]MBB6459032.1 hypothetical protein [Flammeovirga kamogawensis]QWG08602.1 T9SS type A sorting domain-containing protein [Flammeovirga kamogawensis]TRX66895.1 T9SS type A sorting domain-containing protein [Flammeovirga kamogawensis]